MVEATLPQALAQRFDIHPLKAKVVKTRKKPRFVRGQKSMSQCRKYFLKCKGVAKPNSIAAEDCPNLVKFFWVGNASQEQNRSHTLKLTMVRKTDIPVLSKYVYYIYTYTY